MDDKTKATIGLLTSFSFWASLYLFIPLYDVEIKQYPYSKYNIAEENEFTLSACRETADRYKAYDYFCVKHTGWGRWMNKYSIYDSKHR